MEPQIILVLGSFDKETKEILNAVKNDVVKIFSGLDVYCFLLDDVELYASRDGEYRILVERYNRDLATVFLFDSEGTLLHTEDITVATADIALETHQFIKNWCQKMDRVQPDQFIEHGIFLKLELLFKASKTVLVIRHKEETRGGEYIELAYGIGRHPDKFYFFAKNDILLSIMVDEILKRFNVQKRTYVDIENLIQQALDIVRQNVKQGQ